MSMDPQIQALLAYAPPYPGARHIPLDALRGIVSDFAKTGPKPPISIGDVSDHEIARADGGALDVRVYRPVGKGPWPVLLYFHGGGFVLGDLESHDTIARKWCEAARALVVSVDYRLAPEHVYPAATDDAWTALEWIAKSAVDLGGDVGRLAVVGDSAGALLAASLALRARDQGGPAIRAQILFYGSGGYPAEVTDSFAAFKDGPILTADDMAYFWELYLADPLVDSKSPYASPREAASHAGLPPAFVATAQLDPSRDDGENYGGKLQAAGVPVVISRRPGMVHGFLSWLGLVDEAQAAMDDAAAWLERQWAA